MFYRHKLILSLLANLPDSAGATRLHKLMLLLAQAQTKPAYDFVPYKYGGFSFQLRQDVETLVRQGWLIRKDEEKGRVWQVADVLPVYRLKPDDQQALASVLERFGRYTRSELIRYTYQQSPYHAINSTVVKEHLNAEEIVRVQAARPTFAPGMLPTLFTIGYEGISLDTYINQLIRHGVKLLCDVRKNAFSMKWGFSLGQLQPACEAVGIRYLHMPNLGIESSQRKNLDTQLDRDQLFQRYAQETLTAQATQIEKLIDLLKTENRVAITCFEREVCQCHRGKLAETIVRQEALQLIHL